MSLEELIPKLKNMENLPTLPSVVADILRMLGNPSTTATDVTRVITNDQALSTKILKLVNSAFYGFSKRISTISHAVVILGFNTVKSLALSVSVFGAFQENSEGEFQYESFWEHSIAVGVFSKMLAEKVKFEKLEEVFMAGILHDIGKLVLDQTMPKMWQSVLEEIENNGISPAEAEMKVFDAKHTEVGGWIAEEWSLPPLLCDTIRFHHEPKQSENFHKVVAFVALGNWIAHMQRIGFNVGGGFALDLDPEIFSLAGVTETMIAEVMKQAPEELEKAGALKMLFKHE